MCYLRRILDVFESDRTMLVVLCSTSSSCYNNAPPWSEPWLLHRHEQWPSESIYNVGVLRAYKSLLPTDLHELRSNDSTLTGSATDD